MPEISAIGPALAALGTFAGIWVVAFLFRWFQRDFAAAYREELREERERREKAEAALDEERRKRRAAESEAAHLRTELAGHVDLTRPEHRSPDHE